MYFKHILSLLSLAHLSPSYLGAAVPLLLPRMPGFIQVVRYFPPNWFAMTMGTGVLFVLLLKLPVQVPGQLLLAQFLWGFNALLFSLFSLLFLARLVFFHENIRPMLEHPLQSMYLGTIPMAFAMQITGLCEFGPQYWGEQVYQWALWLWWIDAVLAVISAILVPYMMFTRQQHGMQNLTAAWLLPVVAPEMIAGCGVGLSVYWSSDVAQPVLLASIGLWGMSLMLALAVISVLLLRLVLHKLPEADMASTSWLPVSALSTAALVLLLLGDQFTPVFAGTALGQGGGAIKALGLLGGLALWGAALWWLLSALFVTLRYIRERMQFNLGWWGFTFPLGVCALTSLELAQQTGFALFSWFGDALAGLLLAVWLLVMHGTLRGVCSGNLFYAPPKSAA